MNSTRFNAPAHIVLALFLLAPHLVFAEAAGPQRVPVPPILTRPNASKPKTDRSKLPPIPVFKDIARELGVTASHIAAPDAHYVIDSISGGVGLFDCDDDGRLDIVLVNNTLSRLKGRGMPRDLLPVKSRSLAAAQFDRLPNIPPDCTKSPLLLQLFPVRRRTEESCR
jgi:hypothetical protein